MKLRNFIMLAIGALTLFTVACSTKKDAFVNRNWHALNTRYNVLYNGNLAFEEGRQSLNTAYSDNYWEILPVERMQVTDQIRLDSEDNNPSFLLAEEKATKAIQKHSMDVDGSERNPQIDEAFLLLGKARYFDERFIPALEAFNYVLRRYERSNKLGEARIWREKTHLRLGYDELALKNLKNLFKYDVLSDQEYADARAITAQAYINLKALDTAAQQMKIAAAYTKKSEEKGRYYYILGQLYNRLGYADSADIAFDKVIELNRRIPRVYLVNAQLQKIRNVQVDETNAEEVREYLADLAKNRENRPYLDKIYRSMGEYYEKIGAVGAAKDNYNKSLQASRNEPYLNSLNYTDLAEFYFDDNSYKLAGAYYDSVLLNTPENSREFRSVSKKRENLDDVIAYEAVVQETDSILGLIAMSDVEREIYFQTYIDSLKIAEEQEALEKQERAEAGFQAFGQSQGGQQNQGKFYFYNITSLGYGKNEFRMRWGDRELEDNWRWSTKSRILTEDTQLVDAEVDPEEAASEAEKFSLAYYMDRVPDDPMVVDSLKKERNFANYQLGLIYKEKFKEPMLAAARLEAVLDAQPEERLILPSKYNLYKIYQEEGSPLQEQMKRDIVENHPESRYASILTNPEIALSDLQSTQEARYAELFQLFKAQEYLQVITGTEAAIDQYTGEPIVPKMELLKANAIGRLQGFEQFREALNYIALNYPNTPEGKKAQILVEEQIPKLESRAFSDASTVKGTSNWKVVFPFNRTRHDKALELKKLLEDSMKDLGYKYTVSRDIYNLDTEFVVVHGFPSQTYAIGYAELLKNNKDYRVTNENFVILSDNYKVVQVHKNLADYQNHIQTP